MIEKVHEDFLARYGAKEIACRGRTLYDHLRGTHDLLRDWGNPRHVCLGGLFHGFYGSATLRQQRNLEQRPTVRALIGKDAETLVYLFCVIDRPKVMLDAQAYFTRHLFDHNCHHMVSVPKKLRDDLVEIEAANLLEQGHVAADTLTRLGKMGISDRAKAAVAVMVG